MKSKNNQRRGLRFLCPECGGESSPGECDYVLTDQKGNGVYEEELAEWLMKNRPQEETPPAAGKNHPKAISLGGIYFCSRDLSRGRTTC